MQLMARAWKERFFETFAAVSQKDVVSKAQAHVDRWTAQTSAGIACDAANNNIPTIASNQAEVPKVVPLFAEILYFWNGLQEGTTTWPDSRALKDEKESCFPGHAVVQVLGRGRTYISDLKVGDHVLAYGPAGGMSYEPVLAFLHAMAGDSTKHHSFIEVIHACGDFSASSNHIVFIIRHGSLEDKLVGDLEIGDQLLSRKKDDKDKLDNSLESCPVLRIQPKYGHNGMYAPLTPTGTILVDDVVASTYASAQGSKFSHSFMHAVFFPVRAYHNSGLSSLLASSWVSSCSRGPTPWFCQGSGTLSSEGMDEMHPLPYLFSEIMSLDKLLR